MNSPETPLHTLTIVAQPDSLLETTAGIIAAREHTELLLEGKSRGALARELRVASYPLVIAVDDEASIDAAVAAWTDATEAPVAKDYTFPEDADEEPEDDEGDFDEDDDGSILREVRIDGITSRHYKSAMVLLGVCDAPVAALAATSALARTTGDAEFWAHVMAAMFECFPPSPAMMMGQSNTNMEDDG